LSSLLISEIFPPAVGGSGRYFWEVYRGLPRDAYLVAAAKHLDHAEFDAAEFDAHAELTIQRGPLAFPQWGLRSYRGIQHYVRAFRWLSAIVRRERVSQVHAGRALPEGWLALLLNKRFGLPYLCYTHGEELSYGQASRELGWMMRRVHRSARMMVANSENTARLLQKDWQVARDKLHVLHPGTDTDRYRPAAPDHRLRQRLGWNGRKVVLTVGRLEERKGHDQMLRALRQVRDRVPEVLYAVIGEGPQRGRLEQIVDEQDLAGHVQLLGGVDPELLVGCFQQCDLFVLPNREIDGDIEGFGIVLVEAQACGKPVVAGDSGGTVETMNAPHTGRVLDCRGPDALAEAVIELLLDEPMRTRMGRAARRWAVEQFRWQVVSAKAEVLFAELATTEPAAIR